MTLSTTKVRFSGYSKALNLGHRSKSPFNPHLSDASHELHALKSFTISITITVSIYSTFILYRHLLIIMERDVNIKLIYIILILLLALGGTTMLYQVRYDTMRESYEQTFREYNKTFANISEKQKSLYSNISDLNVSLERENVLVSKLETKTKELETVSRELARVQQQLFENEGKYDAMTLNNSYANEILNRHINTIGKMQAKIDRLRTDVENNASGDVLLNDIKALQTELNNLKSY